LRIAKLYRLVRISKLIKLIQMVKSEEEIQKQITGVFKMSEKFG
jgi:hypothetical protein